jgi:hypothetical protein
MRVYRLLVPTMQQRINNIVELISDIENPNAAQTLTQAQKDIDSRAASLPQHEAHQLPASVPIPPPINTHQTQMKISELKFQRLKLKDDFDNVYKEIKNVHMAVDMTRLSELRKQIAAVEEEIAALTALLTGVNNTAISANSITTNNSTNAEAVPPSVSESAVTSVVEPVEAFDPVEAAHHCLKLAVCLLKDPELKSMPPQIRSLCDTLIITNIGSVNEHIRTVAVRALNLGK